MNSPAEWIQLSSIPGLGVTGAWRLLSHFKTPGRVLAATRKQLLAVEGIRRQQLEGVLSNTNSTQQAKTELQRLQTFGGRAICYDEPLYPDNLKQLADPPLVLYTIGNPTLLSENSVAIVGSRAATAYGRRIAFHLGEGLVRCGLPVVSGMALGIDSQAHLGALSGSGSTIAVLGCGVDVVYPKQNSSLYRRIIEKGVVVSEYPLRTRPEGFRFPARNRIIAGLSGGVVVVEAAKKSGSLITAQIALDIGREVFAVPGQVDSFKSEGAHFLLQQGAKLVQNIEDITVELEHLSVRSPGEVDKLSDAVGEEIDPGAKELLQLIEPYPQQRDILIEKAGATAARVSELLLFLELEGLIEMLPGDQVRKL